LGCAVIDDGVLISTPRIVRIEKPKVTAQKLLLEPFIPNLLFPYLRSAVQFKLRWVAVLDWRQSHR
jgi:hypothetical protein